MHEHEKRVQLMGTERKAEMNIKCICEVSKRKAEEERERANAS